jgi:hypothetical protein
MEPISTFLMGVVTLGGVVAGFHYGEKILSFVDEEIINVYEWANNHTKDQDNILSKDSNLLKKLDSEFKK